MHHPQRYMIGIDEAGRGPLAGPVAVGVCAVPADLDFSVFAGVKDSKQLSALQRQAWLAHMRQEKQMQHATSLVSAKHIDTFGITHAIQKAMKHALARLKLDPDACTVLLDGSLYAPKCYGQQKTIIKGDESEPVIALASIAAKVRRDTYMIRLAKKYPDYGFEIHKGYGTRLHRERIVQHGICAAHRVSFLTKIWA